MKKNFVTDHRRDDDVGCSVMNVYKGGEGGEGNKEDESISNMGEAVVVVHVHCPYMAQIGRLTLIR